MNKLKAKIALALLFLATISILKTELHPTGNPIPICGDQYCTPPS